MSDKTQLSHKAQSLGWGSVDAHGAEIWDMAPVFKGDGVSWSDWLKLVFYPKKFLLYRAIRKTIVRQRRFADLKNPLRILDVGCGTGATVVDLKKLFGRDVEVYGVDVVQLQIELAQKKVKQHGVYASVQWYDGVNMPFPNAYFDAIHCNDVLGHVEDVSAWLTELYNVLKPGGVLAMVSESALGKHAYIRRYLFDRGVNVDPHAQFHISLFSKDELREKISYAGFQIRTMLAGIWAYVFLYPEEVAPTLLRQKNFFFLSLLNRGLVWLKKKTHPVSTAAVELWALVEMLTVGRVIESQGYVIIAHKEE